MSNTKRYNSRGNWWYEGATCEHDGCNNPLDDPIHHEYVNRDNHRRVNVCKEHYYLPFGERNSKNNPIDNAISARAIEKAGGSSAYDALPKYGKERRELRAEARAEILSEKKQPDNILQIAPRTWTNNNGELKTANSVTLKSTVRNDGLPEGIVTPSEKKVIREKKKIKYVPEGWIYALKNHMAIPGFLKLGKTNDLKRRLADFNTAGDFEMMYWVKVVDVKVAEDMLHAYFIDSHHLREWFKVDLKDAIEAMDFIANTVNNNEGVASENAISKS